MKKGIYGKHFIKVGIEYNFCGRLPLKVFALFICKELLNQVHSERYNKQLIIQILYIVMIITVFNVVADSKVLLT